MRQMNSTINVIATVSTGFMGSIRLTLVRAMVATIETTKFVISIQRWLQVSAISLNPLVVDTLTRGKPPNLLLIFYACMFNHSGGSPPFRDRPARERHKASMWSKQSMIAVLKMDLHESKNP